MNPVRTVLTTMSSFNVHALLMGGQACILYGASEFSRDTDIALHATTENIEALTMALRSLHARRIAVPPFRQEYLLRGHAIHFRCQHPEALNMRIDVMSVMRGVEPFEALWERRMTIADHEGMTYQVLSLADLVRAKKTQRDKDWPMIRRLIEADYASQSKPTREQLSFWFLESRTPAILLLLARNYFEKASSLIPRRALLQHAINDDLGEIVRGLDSEQEREREMDRQYWEPLRAELEILRHAGFPSEEPV